MPPVTLKAALLANAERRAHRAAIAMRDVIPTMFGDAWTPNDVRTWHAAQELVDARFERMIATEMIAGA